MKFIIKREILTIIVLNAYLFFLTFFASNVSATILLSQTNAVYNLGDNINLESKILRDNAFEGFFRVTLNCDGKENLMYFSPIALEKNKEKLIIINFPVTTIGSCYISSSLEDKSNNKVEETKTSSILLSDKIDVKVSVNDKELKPQDTLQLSGTAIKENGKEADGIAIMTFDGKEYSSEVSKGKFSFSLKLDSTIAPGVHPLTINVKDNNNNLGNATASIKVAAVPTILAIETNNESFFPDAVLMITPKLVDQANGIIATTLNVKILKQDSLLKTKTLLEELVKSGNSTIFRFTKFHEPGDYIIEASGQGFNEKKIVTVIRYEKINVTLENDVLHIENIGNVPFKRKIEIIFSIQGQETKKIMVVDLKIGESKSYRLEAPKGIYDIKVNTVDEILTFSRVPLTGSVVATIDLGKEPVPKNNFLIVILIITAALIIVFFVLKATTKKYKIKKEIKSTKEKISTLSTIPVVYSYKPDKLKKDETDMEKYFAKHSERLIANKITSTLVHGTKQEATALILSFQNFEKLNELKKKDASLYTKILNEYFEAIVNKIKENQGVAFLYGNELIVLFNIVKQYRHDLAAIKTAEAIKQITSELNNSLVIKGLDASLAIKAGINIGMINTTLPRNKEIKYTSIGNTTFIARALKERAIANEILMTETIYERVANAIKAKKVSPYYLTEKEATNIYSLEGFSQQEFRDKSRWYIDRALGKV